MKKLLILGGSFIQIPIIKKAREMGHYVITCDYREDNPGHKFAHEYHDVSFTDNEAVLALAKKLQIDGITCYTSEPAAATAAYVAEKLGLPTNPYKSVEILSNKDLYREFLSENNFSVPRAKGYGSYEEAKSDIQNFKMPVVIKPVDSSGSRGISKISSIEFLQEKVDNALSFSRVKRFVIEEYIEKKGYFITGDGFSVDGKLVFRSFANGHLDPTGINPFVPTGISWPYNMPYRIQNKIHDEVQRAWDILEMKTGPVHFDFLIDEEENIYLNELVARHGGCLISPVTEYVTDINLAEYTIKAALGEDCSDLKMVEPKGYWSSYLVHSQKSGYFKNIGISDELKECNLVEYYPLVKEGQSIAAFTGGNAVLGIMILKFSTMDEMLEKMDNMTDWLNVSIEELSAKANAQL
ncbi:ATP-grasp domain-containing protein [Rummeliibacillus pycnus]|uniref:ATP-grasp domain-containing protein n=1 Tax=Rummeliibacillus pycnus TaxID=101070 RepID=UPI003D294C53